jgi:xanthine/CO dehydrogenase XdhC/CoxF family maturation factor
VDIVIQPVRPEDLETWTRVAERLAGDAPFALGYPLEEGGPGGITLLDAPAGGDAIFVEVLTPPPRLLVCGAGDDARPFASFAAAAGFRVIVVDHRAAYLTAERFPSARGLLPMRPTDPSDLPAGRDTYAVVMTHSLDRDTEWVRRLLATDVPYVGMLGPRARTDGILEKLGAAGSDRVFGPVGLDLGADGPEQVAVSIVAELLSVWSGRELRHLREREAAVHAER